MSQAKPLWDAVGMTLAGVAVILCVAAFGGRGVHPSFAELNESDRQFLSDKPNIEKAMETYSRLAMTPAERQKLLKSGRSELLVGAYGPFGHDPEVISLLSKAAAATPGDVTARLALALAHFGGTGESDESHAAAMAAVKALQVVDPDNAVPVCMEGALHAMRENRTEARAALMAAVQKPEFRYGGPLLRRRMVEAADFVGYSRFAARYRTLGVSGEAMKCGIFIRATLKREDVTPEEVNACLALARRMQKPATFSIEEMLAVGMQIMALEKLPATDETARELARLKAWRKANSEMLARLQKAHDEETEGRMVRYLDDLLATSEREAAERLLAERKQTR